MFDVAYKIYRSQFLIEKTNKILSFFLSFFFSQDKTIN